MYVMLLPFYGLVLNSNYSYEDTGFAMKFTTSGYLVAIMSIVSFAIMPRAKFIQTMVLNLVKRHPPSFKTVNG